MARKNKKKNIVEELDKKAKDIQIQSNTTEKRDESSIMDDYETELNSNEPVRELFTGKNIRYKTQLTEEQRGAVSILYHAYLLCIKYGIQFDGLKYVLDEYIDFGPAMDRKSRDEFVKAHQSINIHPTQQGNINPQSLDNMKL